MNRTFTPELDAGVLRRLEGYAAHFAADFNRPRQRAWCAVYLAGLLQDGERKSIEPLSRRVTLPAALAGTSAPDQGLQQFVSQSTWDEGSVASRYRALLADTFADDSGVFVLDDTTFPKAGTHSVGVQRQYCGAPGKKANCQAAVSLHYVSARRATCRWACACSCPGAGWRMPGGWTKRACPPSNGVHSPRARSPWSCSTRAEAIALAHDLGHPPFGHPGEDTLDRLMKGHGGFDHNAQSLRIVEVVETSYPDFPGLNLTYEVTEGLRKHQQFFDAPSGAGERFPCPLTYSAMPSRCHAERPCSPSTPCPSTRLPTAFF